MKEELGRNYFEGRSWRGFHHHASLVMLAYGFLALEQLRAKIPGCAGEKKGLGAADNPAGSPPRITETPEADSQAGLYLLQSLCSRF